MQLELIEIVEVDEENSPIAGYLSLVKAQRGIEHDNMDTILTAMINDTIEEIQARTGAAFIATTYKLSLPCFPRTLIEIPIPPLATIDELVYFDGDNGWRELEEDTDFTVLNSHKWPAQIYPVESFPSTHSRWNAVQITFSTGAITSGVFKDLLRNLVAWKDQNREGGEYPESICNALALLSPKIYRYRGI